MQKLLKATAYTAITIIAVVIIASFSIKSLIPINRIKQSTEAYLSKRFNAEVKIKSASISLISGIKFNGLSIANAKGYSDEPFFTAKAIELHYSFWPLFRKQVIIPEIKIISPQLLIERSRRDKYNFEDLFSDQISVTVKTSKKSKRRRRRINVVKVVKTQKIMPPSIVELIINNAAISRGTINFVDYGDKDGSVKIKNLEGQISGILLAAVKPLQINAAATCVYQGKNLPLSLKGNLELDLKNNIIKTDNFSFGMGNDSLLLSGKLANYKKLTVTLTSDKFPLDPLLGGITVSAGPITPFIKNLPKDFGISGKIDFKKSSFSGLQLADLVLDFSLAKQNLSLKASRIKFYGGTASLKGVIALPSLSYNFNEIGIRKIEATPFINDFISSFAPNILDMKNKIEGKLDISASLNGNGGNLKSINGSGIVLLSEGRIKKLKSLSNLGEKYKIPLLKQDLLVGGLRLEAILNKEKLSIKKLTLKATDLQAEFEGIIDLEKLEYLPNNKLTLKFSPNLSKLLPNEFSAGQDSGGLLALDFELGGKLSNPEVNLDLKQPIETKIGNFRVKIETKKIEIESKPNPNEGKQKVKEILTF